jgi:hypothetical protein
LEENIEENEDIEDVEYLEEKGTIKETSLFYKDFLKSIQEIVCNVDSLTNNSIQLEKNENFSINAFEILQSYMHLYPYWSLICNQTDMDRSSNAISESYFDIGKNHILLSRSHLCPYEFVLKIHGNYT